jgi:glycosyltransferase domain-containing protein
MSDLNEKLTILLPLKDKEPFTWRWLSWAQESALPYDVLIADGGKSGIDQRRLKNFADLRLHYIRYPFDGDLIDFYAKMVDASAKIGTPYTVLACNDDFHSLNGLRKSVEFLDAHSDYIAAAGDQQDFAIKSCLQGQSFAPHYGEFVIKDLCYPAKSLEQNTAWERIEDYVNNHFNSFLWGGILRTKALAATWEAICKSAIDDLRFTTHLFYLLPLTWGKTKRISGLYGLHQANPGESSGSDMLESFPTWWHWMQNASWDEDFKKFASIIGNSIATADGTSMDTALSNFVNLYLGSFGRDLLANIWPDVSRSFFPPLAFQPPDKDDSELRQLIEFLLLPRETVAGFIPVSRPPEKKKNTFFSKLVNFSLYQPK